VFAPSTCAAGAVGIELLIIAQGWVKSRIFPPSLSPSRLSARPRSFDRSPGRAIPGPGVHRPSGPAGCLGDEMVSARVGREASRLSDLGHHFGLLRSPVREVSATGDRLHRGTRTGDRRLGSVGRRNLFSEHRARHSSIPILPFGPVLVKPFEVALRAVPMRHRHAALVRGIGILKG